MMMMKQQQEQQGAERRGPFPHGAGYLPMLTVDQAGLECTKIKDLHHHRPA